MTKKYIIISALITLIVGIVIGSRLNNKMKQRNDISRFINTSGNKLQIKKKMMNFVVHIPEEMEENKIAESDVQVMENAISTHAIGFKFIPLAKDVPQKFKNLAINHKLHSGLMSALRLYIRREHGSTISPFLTASYDSKSECFNETQLISPHNSTSSIANNIIGIEERTIFEATLALNELSKKNIKPRKIIILKDFNKAKEKLLKGEIDGLFVRALTYSNGRIDNPFGMVKSDTFVNQPSIKILMSSHYQLPCRVYFLSDHLTPQTKTMLTSKFVEVFKNENSAKVFARVTGISSVKEMSAEEQKKVAETVRTGRTISLKSLANEISEE